MPQSNQIWYLIARSLSGEATHEELVTLEDALRQNADIQQQYNILKSFWQAGHDLDEIMPAGEESRKISRILQLAKVQELLPQEESPEKTRRAKKRGRLVKRLIAYSCAVVVVTTVTWLVIKKNSNDAPGAAAVADASQHAVASQNGSRTRTMLPDGTTVWLNAGSKIYFDNDFAGATREVRLEGEAYFDVVKNPHRPFIVHAAGIDIKVLGTVFDVKSYAADKTVETTLIRGLVQVTRQGYPNQKPIYLHPNEKLVVQKDMEGNSNAVASAKIAPPVLKFQLARLDSTALDSNRLETAWVYNRLEFRGDNFEALAGKLERWYNITIVFEDEKVKQLTFNGSFENETVEQAFTALKAAVPFNFSINGHEITIKSL